MNKKSKEYTTPYKYKYTLDPKLAKGKNRAYIIYHRGFIKLAPNNKITWSEETRITRKQFNEITKGTKGIIEDSIKGNFLMK